MPEETLTQEQFEQELEKLVNMHSVDTNFDIYGRYKSGKMHTDPKGDPIREKDIQRALGQVISPSDPSLFLMETQSFLETQVANYQSTRKNDVEEAGKKVKDKLILEYSSQLNTVMGEYTTKRTEELKKQFEKEKELTVEQKEQLTKHTIEIELSDMLGQYISRMDINPEYKGNDTLVEAANRIKKLRRASPEEKHEIVAEEIIKKDGLHPSYKLARRPWDSIGGNLVGMSARVLGKQFITEKDGKYTVNDGLLKEAYSHTDALKTMSFQYTNPEA